MWSGPRCYKQGSTHFEVGSNTFAVTLRVVGGDEKGVQCLGVQLGHCVRGEYKYEGLAFQVGTVSNLRQ
jgi:hypothetical protein